MPDIETESAPVETRSGECPAAAPGVRGDNGADPGATENTKAKRMFLNRVKEIPGVVHVEPFGGQVIGEQSFIVYVRDGDITAEYGVYTLEGEVYQQYPEASLTVKILEQSDLRENTAGIAATSG